MYWILNNGHIVIPVILVLYLIIFIVQKAIKYNRFYKLKDSNIQNRFKYLDVFYYDVYVPNYNAVRDDSIVAFVVIKDIETDTVYAINPKDFVGCKLWTKVTVSLFKGEEKVEFDEEGIYAIKKEYPDFCQKDGNLVTLKHLILRPITLKITNEKEDFSHRHILLEHINKDCDYSILENAVFIKGVAKFNDKGNKDE